MGKKKSKYPKSKVTATRDPEFRRRFYEATDRDAPLGPRQLAAGTIQHPRTGLWQVWWSTNGLDINHISAHHEATKAATDVEEIKAAATCGDLFDENKVTALIERLIAGGDAEPEDLPDDLVRRIARDILHSVIEIGEK